MPAATVERQKAPWYLCPDCRGLGWIESDKRVVVLQGVRLLGHIPCPRCEGYLMVKSRDDMEDGTTLKPIKRCPKCGNYFAVGGGEPAKKPCPHNHSSVRSHCHWHDLSVPPPPDTDAGRGIRPAPVIDWEAETRAE